MEEERREHVNKMKKMEMEMEQVFEMKVKEKVQKLKDSEAEVSYASNARLRHTSSSVGGAHPPHRGSFNPACCRVQGSLLNADRWGGSVADVCCCPVCPCSSRGVTSR